MVDHNATVSLAASAYTVFEPYYKTLPTRFAYESDGTSVIFTRGGVDIPQTTAQLATLNSMEQEMLVQSTGWPLTFVYIFVFPELRNISYINAINGGESGGPSRPYTIDKSTDTTTGFDGTWTSLTSINKYYTSSWQYNRLRNEPVAVSASGVRALRFTITVELGTFYEDGGFMHKIHIYGDKVDSAANSRLAFWHPTRDEELTQTYFDWGYTGFDEDTRSFRIKNVSTHKRAVGVIVSTDDSNEVFKTSSYHTLNYQSGIYAPSVNIGDLQLGQISDVFNLKRSFSPSMGGSAFTLSLKAHPTQWKQYIHYAAATLTATANTSPTMVRSQYATAQMAAEARVSDGILYRNTGQYRNTKTFRSGNVTVT